MPQPDKHEAFCDDVLINMDREGFCHFSHWMTTDSGVTYQLIGRLVPPEELTRPWAVDGSGSRQ